MIKFRQKQYAAPLVAALGGKAMIAMTAGSTALSMKQAHDAEKQNEEIAEQQRRDAAKTRAALDRLANSNASPEAKSEAASLFSDLRTFAAPAATGGLLRTAGGFAKDLFTHYKPGIKKAAAMGAGFAGVGYIGNRIATSMKNHDEGQDDKNKSFLKKAALTTAVVGGGILAAKKGLIGGKGGKIHTFMTSGKGGQTLKKAGDFAKENISPVKIEGGKVKGMNWGNTAFMAMPVVSYAAQRKTKGDIVENTSQQETDQQKQYANTGGILSGIKTAWNALRSNPGRTISGGFNKLGHTFGMMGTKGGTKASEASVKALKSSSNNKWTQKTADWLLNHEKSRNVIGGVGALAIGGTAMSLGGKLVNKPMKMLDKEAYKMEDQENGKV